MRKTLWSILSLLVFLLAVSATVAACGDDTMATGGDMTAGRPDCGIPCSGGFDMRHGD